jgi:hypothetical protein
MSLTELQNELQASCDTEASVQTILTSLQREGYTMKTVRPLLFYHYNCAHISM